jgi:hypothetical protein
MPAGAAFSSCGDAAGVWPSCSRALARVRPNTHDANGYYEFLGLYPWAGAREIRDAARAGFKRWHPDGTSPDESRFVRLREIAGTLLDPEAKAAYDSVPADGLWIDSEVRQAVGSSLGDELQVEVEPLPLSFPAPRAGWDWFSDGDRAGDGDLAAEWYGHLVATAPLASYTRTIKVMLVDGPAAWRPMGGVMCVPRRWEPSRAAAWSMFAALVLP